MISFFSYLFTHKFSNHISKRKEGIEENVNSSIFFFKGFMPTVDHGLTFYSYWWLLYWKSSCLLEYTNKILVWGMLCLKFTSDVYCTMQLALFNQQAEHPHWYSKWCQTFLNWLFKGWMKVDLSNFPFFVNENFQIAPNYSYGSSTINFSNVIFLEL